MNFFKNNPRRIAFAGGLTTLAALGSVIAALLVENAVTITTEPIKRGAEIYIDLNGNGINTDTGEYVGQYDVYDWNQPLSVQWATLPVESAQPDNAAYYVAIRQYEIGQPLFGNAYREIKGQFTFAGNGNSFLFESFGFGEDICFGCPSVVVVIPFTYELQLQYDEFYDYVYTPYVSEEETELAVLTSQPFVFEELNRDDVPLSAVCQDIGLPTEDSVNGFVTDGESCNCLADASQMLTGRICEQRGQQLVFESTSCGCR